MYLDKNLVNNSYYNHALMCESRHIPGFLYDLDNNLAHYYLDKTYCLALSLLTRYVQDLVRYF